MTAVDSGTGVVEPTTVGQRCLVHRMYEGTSYEDVDYEVRTLCNGGPCLGLRLGATGEVGSDGKAAGMLVLRILGWAAGH
jgi:hypothetical protein